MTTVKEFTGQYGQRWETIEGLEQTSIVRKHPLPEGLPPGANLNDLADLRIENARVPHGLEIQVIDAYSYQRELSITRRQHYAMEPKQVGTMTTIRDGGFADGTPFEPQVGVPIMGQDLVNHGLQWVVNAYKHPFRGAVETVVSEKVAMRLIDRIWALANEYPTLLFNANGQNDRPRAAGFVHFHDQLLAGAVPSVKLLP